MKLIVLIVSIIFGSSLLIHLFPLPKTDSFNLAFIYFLFVLIIVFNLIVHLIIEIVYKK